MPDPYSLEVVREVWNDKDGDHVEIGPDRDGTDLVELRSKDRDGKIINRISFVPSQAKLVAQAMVACAEELERVKP